MSVTPDQMVDYANRLNFDNNGDLEDVLLREEALNFLEGCKEFRRYKGNHDVFQLVLPKDDKDIEERICMYILGLAKKADGTYRERKSA